MTPLDTKPLIRRIVVVAGLSRSLVNFRGPLVRALRQAGLEVHAVAPELQDDQVVVEKLQGWGVITHSISMQRTGLNPFHDLMAMRDLYRLFREVKPDAVLGYTIKPVIYGTLSAWLARVPNRFALITGLGYAFTGRSTGKRAYVQKLVRHLYSQALSKTHLVFFQNPDDQALFHEMGLLSGSVVSKVVNGSGIDTAHFQTSPAPSSSTVFLLIARLLGDKGVREYVQAAKAVRKTHPQAEFRLVGDIDDNPDSIHQEELDTWIASGDVNYLGWLDDVRPAIYDASVYVLPSYREGTPRTVLEAMAIGRPIITTDAPGCRETVVDGENGYLVPIKAVDELSQAMLRLIDEPSLIPRMGQRSREIAEDKYDVHKVNEVMLKSMGIDNLNTNNQCIQNEASNANRTTEVVE
ncbi:glycosyltransferase family 4 protein [Halomonas sp. MA07-2]|uniref:glycosyltransferase family 4 protein n=1 Tax=Halomonas sp. MA07-2 TaxID=3440841 RepID=UPI003EE8B3D0